MSTIIEALNRRYATKAYDTTKKVSEQDLHTIMESMRLAPSSFGIQPWKFIVVTDPTIREELKGHSRGQPQVTDASHLIVLTVKKNLTAADIDEYIASIATTRNIPTEALQWFRDMMVGRIEGMDQSSIQAWNTRQSYIALGFGLHTAAQLNVDASPMEWFDPQKYNEVLWLTDYTSTVIMAVGYRSEDDHSQSYAKVRFPAERVIEYR